MVNSLEEQEREQPRLVGYAQMLIDGVVLDDNNKPKDGWSYYNLPVDPKQPQSNILPFADNRTTVYEVAHRIDSLSTQIGQSTKRDPEKAEKLKEERRLTTVEFNDAIRGQAAVCIEVQYATRGSRQWQRITLYDLEADEEAKGEFVVARFNGDATPWWSTPFWKVTTPSGRSMVGVQPLIVPFGKSGGIVERTGNIVRFKMYECGGKGWLPDEVFQKIVEKVYAPPPPPAPSTDDENVNLVNPETDITISCMHCKKPMIVTVGDYQTGETVECPECNGTNGPLINEHTLLPADAVGVLFKLTDEQVVKLGDGAQITDVGKLAAADPAKVKELLGLRTITQAKNLVERAKTAIEPPTK